MAKEASPSDAIRASLKALLEQVPILRNAGTKIILAPHQDLILKARAQGHTYREIARALAEAGMKVSPQTVRRQTLRVMRNNGQATITFCSDTAHSRTLTKDGDDAKAEDLRKRGC